MYEFVYFMFSCYLLLHSRLCFFLLFWPIIFTFSYIITKDVQFFSSAYYLFLIFIYEHVFEAHIFTSRLKIINTHLGEARVLPEGGNPLEPIPDMTPLPDPVDTFRRLCVLLPPPSSP